MKTDDNDNKTDDNDNKSEDTDLLYKIKLLLVEAMICRPIQ